MPILRADPPEHSRKPVTVRAVYANAGVEAWYHSRLLGLVNEMHVEVRQRLLAAYLTLDHPELAHDAPGPDNPARYIRGVMNKFTRRWTEKIDIMASEIAAKFARKSQTVTQTQLRAAFKEAGFTVKFQPTPGSQAAYQAVAAEQVNLIKSIPAQYLKDVQSKVWASVMKGGDVHGLQIDLQSTYGVAANRAATIAADQNRKAKAIIERARRQEMGITHAIWVHSSGGKTPRKTHIAMDGKPYRVAEGMYDSAEGKYVLPGELINCGCTSRAVIPAFETVEQARARTRAGRPEALFRAAARRAR